MKKTFKYICLILGSGMVGGFANRLNTVWGCIFFALGIALAVGAMAFLSENQDDNMHK